MSKMKSNIYPVLASMVLPGVVALALEHERSTSPSFAGELHLPPAASTSAPAVCSDPAGAGEEVWPLRDICAGCGASFSIELRGPHGCRNCQ